MKDEITDAAQEATVYAPAILAALEETLNVPFPLPKLDHAAVQDFGGGMENYGLIIYEYDDQLDHFHYLNVVIMKSFMFFVQ